MNMDKQWAGPAAGFSSGLDLHIISGRRKKIIMRQTKNYPGRVLFYLSCATEFRNKIMIRSKVDRKSTRLNSSHVRISYAVFCLKKKSSSVHASCVGQDPHQVHGRD